MQLPYFVPGICHAKPLRLQIVQVYLTRLPAAVRQTLKLLIQKFNIQGFYLQKINSLVYNSRSQIFSDWCHRLNLRQRQFLIPSLVIHCVNVANKPDKKKSQTKDSLRINFVLEPRDQRFPGSLSLSLRRASRREP